MSKGSDNDSTADQVRILIDYYKALNSSQGRLVRCLGLKVFAEEWIRANG